MKLYETALGYVGTPHINRGNVKGAGLDCCTLPAHLIKDTYGIDIKINFNYSADWYCKRNCKEILLPYLEEHFKSVEELQEGDIISYSFGRSKYAHLSMYLGNNKVVHCSADTGVEITSIDNWVFFNSKGKSRVSGYWRLKE